MSKRGPSSLSRARCVAHLPNWPSSLDHAKCVACGGAAVGRGGAVARRYSSRAGGVGAVFPARARRCSGQCMTLVANGPYRSCGAEAFTERFCTYTNTARARLYRQQRKNAVARTMSTQNASTRLLSAGREDSSQGAEEPVSHRSSPLSTRRSDPGVDKHGRGAAHDGPSPFRLLWGPAAS